MKKRGLGSFCITNIISSICVSLFLIITLVAYCIIFKEIDIFFGIVFVLCIFVALQRMFRVIGCYFELKEELLILNYVTIKKKTKWYDFMAIGRRLSFSYQKEYKDILYEDIESIDFIKDKKINIAFWNKKEVAIKLKNGRYVWIVKNVFSKKQLRKIIEYICDRNNKVAISNSLKLYLK